MYSFFMPSSRFSFNFSIPRLLVNFSGNPRFSDIDGFHTFIVSASPDGMANDSVFWNGTYAGINPKTTSYLPLNNISQGFQDSKKRFIFHDTDSGIDYSDSCHGRYVRMPTLPTESGKSGSIEMFIPKKELSQGKSSLDSFLKSSGIRVSDKAYNAATASSMPVLGSFKDKVKNLVNKIPLGPAGAKTPLGKVSYVLGAGALGLLGLGLFGLHQHRKNKEVEQRYQRFLAMRRQGMY